jgi:hypothetical protein
LNLTIAENGIIYLTYPASITDDITGQPIIVQLSEDEVIAKFLVATHNYRPSTITPALI